MAKDPFLHGHFRDTISTDRRRELGSAMKMRSVAEKMAHASKIIAEIAQVAERMEAGAAALIAVAKAIEDEG